MSAMRIFEAKALLDISRDHIDHRVRREKCWYGYSDGDYWGAMPFVPALFRGQSSRHLPMLPAICRGLHKNTGQLWQKPHADQAKIVLRQAQSRWFSRELDHHPITAHAAAAKLKLDRVALAQHYGIPTGYLDLTDDFNVSAFFATCRETKQGWEPVEDGVGVIYRVDLKSGKNPFDQYKAIGPQVLPRPTEQCAWVTELPIEHAFDGWSDVTIMQFNHDRSIGEHFLDKFAGGASLFPPDPLADVATEIVTCHEVPTMLIEESLKWFADDPHGIRSDQTPQIQNELSQLVTMIDYRRLLTDEQISSLLSDFEWRTRMLAEIEVNWRLVWS